MATNESWRYAKSIKMNIDKILLNVVAELSNVYCCNITRMNASVTVVRKREHFMFPHFSAIQSINIEKKVCYTP
jgi:hypothetical protein